VSEGLVDAFQVAGKFVPMGWYMLGAQKGKAGVFPLANVLTRRVGVDPGSQVEVLAALSFNWSNYTFDVGYNLFAKERESVSIKKCGWPEETYAIAQPKYDPNAVFATNGDDIWSWTQTGGVVNTWISPCDLCVEPAVTPVYVTHKIHAAFGFEWNRWEDYPIMLGLGGSYEFAQGMNSAIEGYALWLKGGITF